jgi:hypothetical protein
MLHKIKSIACVQPVDNFAGCRAGTQARKGKNGAVQSEALPTIPQPAGILDLFS